MISAVYIIQHEWDNREDIVESPYQYSRFNSWSIRALSNHDNKNITANPESEQVVTISVA